MLVSVVVPLHNEEENIEELYAALKSVMDAERNDYELLFIDDGSTDRTLDLLEPIGRKDPKVRLLRFRRNFGKAAAWAAGFDHAGGDIIVTIDGDLQNDPKDIPKMVSLIGEYDIVNGWRKKRKDPFIIRRFPSIIANWMISRVTGVKLRDYGSGLKAYKAEVVKNINMYGEMHRFIPAVASWYGVKIKEIETTHHPRRHGKSKYGISRTMMVILDLITVKFLQSFSTKPLQAFGPIGLLCGFTGLFINLYLMFLWFSGQSIGTRPLLLLGVLLIIVGIQLIGMGLLGEMLVSSYHEGQRKPLYVLRYPENKN
ncbi:MAG TPA: glycosyltransferase [Nitrospirae bacterium]|nr:glycosyltransferase [Nitrospirota bacterium]HDZ03166.1 glycosyltransferase [Nitrospirota bacterium]